MKKIAIPLILAATLSASAVFAQQQVDANKTQSKAQKPTTEVQMTHKAVGVVRAINAQAGALTLEHEAINSLNWPPMTMGFRVQDKALLDKLVVGQKVSFELIQGAKGYVVTAIK